MQEKELLFNLLRDLRRVEYFVNQVAFDSMYSHASESMQKTVRELLIGSMQTDPKLRTVCIDSIHELIKHETRADISIRDLKIEAQLLGIRNYSRLPKSTLVKRIEEKHDRRSQQSINRNSGTSNGNGLETESPSLQQNANRESQ